MSDGREQDLRDLSKAAHNGNRRARVSLEKIKEQRKDPETRKLREKLVDSTRRGNVKETKHIASQLDRRWAHQKRYQ